MKYGYKSLSFKLLLSFLASGLCMILILYLTVGQVLRQTIRETVNGQLQHYFHYINAKIGSPPNLQLAQQLSRQLNVKIIIAGHDLNWSSHGDPIVSNLRYYTEQLHINRGQILIGIENPPYTTTFIIKKQLPIVWKLMRNALLGIFLVLLLVYLLLRHIISPLKIIQKGIKQIAAGDLEHRIELKQRDEFGQLSDAINNMSNDIKQMLEAKQQLLLAISHELRTPLTRTKVALSLMDDSRLKSGLENDIAEMQGLIDNLLEAERLNHRHQVLNLSPVDINELVETIISQYYPEQPIVQLLNQNIKKQPLDKPRWQFMIKNLVDNALKHRKQTSDKITIRTDLTKKNWSLSVVDQGYGIPARLIPFLTEPFYRLDSSRQRDTGGYGLGLYIIKMIIEAHHGKLRIESEEDVGTHVILTSASTCDLVQKNPADSLKRHVFAKQKSVPL